MNAALRRWASTSNPTIAGLELLGAPCLTDTLGATLASVHAESSHADAAFLMIRLAPTAQRDLATAIGLARDFSAHTRVSFAIGSETLLEIGSRRMDTAQTTLTLDDVDAETPPGQIAHEAIDAIRFSPGFVLLASRSVRYRCVLDSMMSLARSLGIATLSAVAEASRDECALGLKFDWLPIVGRADLSVGLVQANRGALAEERFEQRA